MYWFLAHCIFPICTVAAVGELLAIVYLSIYCRYTSDRRCVLRTIAVAVALLVVVTLYVALAAVGITQQPYKQVQDIVGYLAVMASVCFYGSPMERIKRVLQTKSVAPIPINMCVMGAISNSLWLCYAIATCNRFVLVPNALCLTLMTTQCVLYAVYKPSSRSYLAAATTSINMVSAIGGFDEEMSMYSSAVTPKQLQQQSQHEVIDLEASKVMTRSPSLHASSLALLR